MLTPLEGVQRKSLQQVASAGIVPSQAAEQAGSTKAARAVGLTIRNAEFIHVISLSLLISYSQLKWGRKKNLKFPWLSLRSEVNS